MHSYLDQLVQLAIEKSEDGLQFEVYPVDGGALGLDVNGEPYTTPAESAKEIEDTINLLWSGFMFEKNAKPDPQFAEYDQRTLRQFYHANDQEESAEKAHDGQPFKVVRRLTWQECDEENRPMWKIRFDDGFETDAFPEEIYEDEKKTVASLSGEDAADRWPFLTLPEKQFLTEIVSKIDASVYGICVSDGASLTYIKIRWEEISGYCGETELPIIMPAFVYMEHDKWYDPAELGIGGTSGD